MSNSAATQSMHVFRQFVQNYLVAEIATRYAALCDSKKGQRKILESLCHKFASAVRTDAIFPVGYDKLWDKACYVFHEGQGFGEEFGTVREAYEQLSLDDGWLIVLSDASAGIHRPEAKWSQEMLISEQ